MVAVQWTISMAQAAGSEERTSRQGKYEVHNLNTHTLYTRLQMRTDHVNALSHIAERGYEKELRESTVAETALTWPVRIWRRV